MTIPYLSVKQLRCNTLLKIRNAVLPLLGTLIATSGGLVEELDTQLSSARLLNLFGVTEKKNNLELFALPSTGRKLCTQKNVQNSPNVNFVGNFQSDASHLWSQTERIHHI